MSVPGAGAPEDQPQERNVGVLAAARAALAVVDPGVRRCFYLGLAPSIALGMLEAVGVALVLPFVAALGVGRGSAGGLVSGRLMRLVGGSEVPLWIGVVALAALLVRTLASAALTAWQLRVVASSERELTRRLLRIYLTQPWSFHRQRELAELTRNVLLNVWQVSTQMVTPVFTLPSELAVIGGVLVVLVVLSPLVAAAVALLFGAVAVTAGVLGGRRAAQAGIDARTSATELQGRVHDGLRAAKSLSVHGGGEMVAMGLEDALAVNERARYHQALAQYLPRYLLEATLAVGVGGLAILVTGLSRANPVPTLALFATGAVRVVGPLSRVLTASSSLRSGAKLLDPIQRDVEFGAQDGNGRAQGDPAPGPPPVVELRDVSFTYQRGDRPAVAHLGVRLAAGELVALSGPTAAGKTTLVDIVLGLLPPTSGSVLVDGVPLTESSVVAWYPRLGYVPQDAVVLDDTVRHNVALGVADDQIDDRRVRDALAAAELVGLLERLPHGLDHVLGDRDGRLSGGERQRLAIARALYRQPGMLILDEPTSSLDPDTEARLMETLRTLRRGRTILMVTHRTAAAARCDRIIHLEGGRVVRDQGGASRPSVSAQR